MTGTLIGGANDSTGFSSASATRYVPMGTGHIGQLAGYTTEADAEQVCRAAGTVSRLGFRIYPTNTRTVNSTARFRKNGGNGNQVVTITALTTGWFEDSSNSDTLADGDTYCVSWVTGAGGAQNQTLVTMTARFVASSGTKLPWTFTMRNTGGSNHTPSSSTRYMAIFGNAANNSMTSTESSYQVKIKAAGTHSRLRMKVITNTRTTDTTIRTRKNTADGNQAITFGAGVTGTLEDTTNSDTLAVDDLFNYSITTGSGSGSIIMAWVAGNFESSGDDFDIGGASDAANNAFSTANDNFFPFFGGPESAEDLDDEWQMSIPLKMLVDQLRIRLILNSAANNENFTLHVNGSSTALSATITASTTGLFEDTSNAVIVNDGDDVCYLYTQPSSASISIGYYAARCNASFTPRGVPGKQRACGLILGN